MRSPGIHEFAIEGDYEQPKLFGTALNDEDNKLDQIQTLLDRAILSLRTFKAGRVGYEWVRHTYRDLCPVYAPSYGHADLYIPAGIYDVAGDEIPRLLVHAQRVFRISDRSIETACRRLSDAEIRVRAEDQIIDAVVGMEALLLAALSNDSRKTELKYRFAVHYSTLFDEPRARYEAFRVAKHLYDLRSSLAHGSDLPRTGIRLGDDKVSLSEAAKKACEALRQIVVYFLTHGDGPVYKKAEFWEHRYFGVN